MDLAIVVPILNEAGNLPQLLQHLQSFHDKDVEVIIVDGGSGDGARNLIQTTPFKLIESDRGRARQMNAGATACQANSLLFLHADTRLPANADALINQAFDEGFFWGRFDVQIEGTHPMLRVIATMMNWRSRLTGIATGDQAIFIDKQIFLLLNGFPDQALMEDIEISKRLKRFGKPACLRERVQTSGRRWENNGLYRTILLMWGLRLAYWLGADPIKLEQRYR